MEQRRDEVSRCTLDSRRQKFFLETPYNVVVHIYLVGILKRCTIQKQLVRENPQCPVIGSYVVTFALDDFRGQVFRGSHEGLGLIRANIFAAPEVGLRKRIFELTKKHEANCCSKQKELANLA